jgi:hypothetical protein
MIVAPHEAVSLSRNGGNNANRILFNQPLFLFTALFKCCLSPVHIPVKWMLNCLYDVQIARG